MNEPTRDIVILDVVTTLGIVRAESKPGRVVLAPFPDVPPVLAELARARLGVYICDPDITRDMIRDALGKAGLLGLFDESLLFSTSLSSLPAELGQARDAASADVHRRSRWLFVSEDALSRAYARRSGVLTASHILFAADALRLETELYYLRISAPHGFEGADWQASVLREHVVPFHLTRSAGTPIPQILAIGGDAVARNLERAGWMVERLGREDDPQPMNLYSLTASKADPLDPFIHAPADCSPLEEVGGRVLMSDEEELVVSIPAGRSPEEFCLPAAHHDLGSRLLPMRSLLEPRRGKRGLRSCERAMASEKASGPIFDISHRAILEKHIHPDAIRTFVRRYAGLDPLDQDGRILSRHILHRHNARAVAALQNDFAGIGSGELKAEPRGFPYQCGCEKNLEIRMPGKLPGIIIISAHLDSTADLSHSYDPRTDRAPGADDDASGMAAVFCIAGAFHELSQMTEKNHRTFHFLFFNSEEDKLTGSMFYAAQEVRMKSPIAGVFHFDMIGYDNQSPRTFEVHAGSGNEVDEESSQLTQMIKAVTEEFFPPDRLKVQMYPDQDAPGDYAANRSDHHSFHVSGIPACLAIEDFFYGPKECDPPREPNPHWHQHCDVELNPEYAADITLAVAAAAWITATQP